LLGAGCPRCSAHKSEKEIGALLSDFGLVVEPQKKFAALINPKTGRPLRFDYCLPELNLLIERDGQHHFMPVNWSGKITEEQLVDNLKAVQERDRLKTKWAKENGYGLLRIPFWDEDAESSLVDHIQNILKIVIQIMGRSRLQGSGCPPCAKLQRAAH
jgi:very-short-patch-repair endonuclease